MGNALSYRSVIVEVAAGVTLREISIPHRVIEIHVPGNVLNAFVRFGDRTKEAVPLTPGGRNRYCFQTPPSKLFISAAGGDPLTIFGSEEVEPAFFPFASDAASLRNEVACTWPGHANPRDLNQSVVATVGWTTNNITEVMWGAKLGTAPDDNQLYRGRMCWEARTTNTTFAMRQIGGIYIQMPLTSVLTAGQKGEDFSRVFWDTYFINVEGVPNIDGRTGLAYIFRSVGSAGWWEATNYFAWGLGVVDVGGIPIWHFFANRTAIAPTPDESLSLGLIASTNWIRFDILHIAPTETRLARFLIYADNILVLEREWAVGAGSLPDYSGVGATIQRQVIAGESLLGIQMRIGGVSFRRGQLLNTGAFA